MGDLEKLMSSWGEGPCFAEFMASEFTGDGKMQDEDEMRHNGAFQAGSDSFESKNAKRAASLSLECSLFTTRKHFTTIWTGPLLHFAIALEKDTSMPFCKWLCNRTMEGLGTIVSEVHQTTIDLNDMIKFFSRLKPEKKSRPKRKLKAFWGQLWWLQLEEKMNGNLSQPLNLGDALRQRSHLQLLLLTELKQWCANVPIVLPPQIKVRALGATAFCSDLR
jgi:hypothetical protein